MWGPKHTQVYNDGYWPICGAKHPGSMGQDFTECWASAWPVIGNAFERALRGETSFLENQRIFLDRKGYLEETFFTFSFSPIFDETGRVGGLFHPVTETTSNMLAERRTRVLRDVAGRSAKARSADEALIACAEGLSESVCDVPFVAFYAINEGENTARLVATSGLSAENTRAHAVESLQPGASGWRLSEVMESGEPLIVPLDTGAGAVPCGPYPEPPKLALVLPIKPPGGARPVAILVAGASPRRPLDEAYRVFFDLLAAAVTTSVASARAYEEERKRLEALAEIDRARTAFFSNVSHEFRTPLTLMLGPLDDELGETDAPLPGPRWERLDMVRRNSARLLKLVNTLLDFSRVDADRLQAHFEPHDLALRTSELASIFRSAIEKAGLTLTVDCPTLPEPIYVDRDLWEKVVLNLLSNALKHTFDGEIAVTMRWSARCAVLTVHDTGIGIPASELPHLFERFHRVQGARSRSHEGTGIGLALVHQLVTLHGGTVTVASEEGKGSVFTVTLRAGVEHLPKERIASPRAPSAPHAQAASYVAEASQWLRTPRVVPRPPAAQSPAEPAPQGEMRRVLVADDNADLREYVQGLLERSYEVRVVADGTDVLPAALEWRPDLVLTDVMMPGLDGFGVLRGLRAHPDTQMIPVILLSARAGEEASVEGLDAGADDYLVKPFTARDLLARVRTHLELALVRRRWIEEVRAREAMDLAADATRASETKLRKLIDSAIVGVVLARVDDGMLVRANDAFLRMLGHSHGELEERMLGAQLTPPDGRHADELAHLQLRENGSLPLREKEYLHKDGHRVPALVGGAMLDAAECVWFVADMSERKRAEAALRRSEEQLRQAQKMEAVGNLAGGVAHDFNNILAVIMGDSELLVGELSPDDPNRVLVEEISAAAGRASELTRQLLAFGRRQVLQLQDVNLGHVIANMERMLRRLIGEDIELLVHADPELGLVRVDPSQMEQVVMNLAVNARDAMPRGGKLTVETRNVDVDREPLAPGRMFAGGPCIVLTVTDTGVGMNESTRARMFEPFFTTKEVGRGTGLGLATVFGIVEQSGGLVEVDSEVGQGTVFRLYLPRLPASAGRSSPKRPAEKVALGGRETILLVEDEPGVRAVTRRALRNLGYDVLDTASGDEALQRSAEYAGAIDLLVTDVVMPRLSGPELAKRLQATRPKMRVLYTSGYTDDIVVRHGALDGKIAFVQKPVTPKVLAQRVREVLDAERK